MKATIKLPSGAQIDLEGTQEEVSGAIHTALGLVPQQQVITIPTVFPYPAPQPLPVYPWPTITWGIGQCPWESGTIISTMGEQNTNTSGPGGYQVQRDGQQQVTLKPLTQGEVLSAMGINFAGLAQTNEMPPTRTVSVFMNDHDKGSVDVQVPYGR